MSSTDQSAEPDLPDLTVWQQVGLAFVLSLGSAVSLGITRFSYALLLPVMRDDLGWTYTLAGSMNTVNAMGYLLGALATPLLMRRIGAQQVLLGGSVLACVFMAASGMFLDAASLLTLRLLAGIASALVFVAGGLLVARLSVLAPSRAGLLLGLYYGGTGWGIVGSALGVPLVLHATRNLPHGWMWAWWALAGLCVLCTLVMWRTSLWYRQARMGARSVNAPAMVAGHDPVPWGQMWRALAGYAMFGVGYIGYMTFVIALLRDQGSSGTQITVFFTLLGLAVVSASRIWAWLLDRAKGGGALALLNALLGVATILPALTVAWPAVLISGLLFGGVFKSLVSSTTAFVRHNLQETQWPIGITAFTVLFALGQIVGPTLVGWVADGEGGLARGLLYSAGALWLGALLAAGQRPLTRA